MEACEEFRVNERTLMHDDTSPAPAVPYAEFLARKQRQVQPAGRSIDAGDVHPALHPWQRRIVTWAVRTGRAALWADTGTGKTFMQLEYARLSGTRALLIAPLAVCHQTVREAAKLGIAARYARSDADAADPALPRREAPAGVHSHPGPERSRGADQPG